MEKSSTISQGSSYSIAVAVMGRLISCLGPMQELTQMQCDREFIQYNSIKNATIVCETAFLHTGIGKTRMQV